MNKKDKNLFQKDKTKKKYKKPTVKSEELITFGALCNGSTSGGRKESVVPAGCQSSRLLS